MKVLEVLVTPQGGNPMKVLVGCLKSDFAVCPSCGSKNIVGIEKEACHCGQCGQAMEITFVNKVMSNEEPEPEDFFMQMSLFDDEF